MAKLQTQGSEMRHKAQLALQLLGQHVENRDSMLLSNEFRMTLFFRLHLWITMICSMFIDYLH